MVRRILLATALGAGLFATAAPAAVACDWEHCPGTSIVCQQMGGCPLYCRYVHQIDRTICIGN